jgi:hypothetical protein
MSLANIIEENSCKFNKDAQTLDIDINRGEWIVKR